MAGASQKKQAVNNVNVLRQIGIIAGVVNALSLIAIFIFRRPSSVKTFLVFSIPGWVCHYILESVGRPKFSEGKLVSAGQDLEQSGLTEYMFDIVYVTLLEDILMILFGSNKVWWLYTMIPAFAAYKVKGIFSSFKQQPSAPVEEEEVPQMSKRQAKLEKRSKRQGL